MRRFPTPALSGSGSSVGVWQTFVVMGLVYFVAMLAGAFTFRVPPPGWTPSGRAPSGDQNALVARSQVWNSAMGLAEAGVEEALAQLNPGAPAPVVDRAANGWGGPSGGVYGPVTRTLPTPFPLKLMP